MKDKLCELCHGSAALYCASDAAFLCFSCDFDVHDANFLVARHVRFPLCSSCRNPSAIGFSGPVISPRHVVCTPCSGEPPLPAESLSEESDSDCVSSTGSAAAAKIRPPSGKRKRDIDKISSSLSSSLTDVSGKDSTRFPSTEVNSSAVAARIPSPSSTPAVSRIDRRAESILEIWRQRLGLSDASVVDWAARALTTCGEMTGLPLRVLLAASFWIGLRMSSPGSRNGATWQMLIGRLEEVSGVPVKLILAAAAKIARARRKPARHDLEEGCAECSP